MLGFVCAFMSLTVVPAFTQIYTDFKVQLPPLTQWIMIISPAVPWVVGGIVAVLFGGGGLCWLLGRLGVVAGETAFQSLPLVGPIIQRSLVAAWCDTVRVGVEAGMDLPAALALAGDVSASGRLRQDSAALADVLAAGGTLDTVGRLSLLPATVPTAMAFGSRAGDLATTLRTLSQLYQEQADLRLAALPAILGPWLLLFIAGLIAVMLVALLVPMLTLIGAVSGYKR
jgi:type IV pilus assembly protein PilC